MESLHVVTFNIHKGFSQFQSRLMVHELRDHLRAVGADLVFLQEVQGLHEHFATRHPGWPAQPQYEFLADSIWSDFAYGRNAVYEHGHHGNAILSRFPILRWDNQDVSMSKLESRGLLHCEIEVPGWRQPLHCINVHLGLFAVWRRRQIDQLRERIERMVPPDAPLVIAGDFNDWTRRGGRSLVQGLALTEVFEQTRGRPARSFPARMPLLHLDRIYVRGFQVRIAHVHRGALFSKLSDHAALSALLTRL
ncbi:MAG: endonuclease/exonuclease/phosphatase family protein [Burkholderiales bacterium]|nr:endonuclease/exonuclease/phosphatase family protein [Burkholderiales bacterium]